MIYEEHEMKKVVFLIFIMSVVLLTAIWQPVYASSGADSVQSDEAATTVNVTKLPKLTINNKTGQQFTLTLRGPKTYYLTVPTGKSNFEVEQGKYTYSYTACGGPQTGNVSVKKSGANLKLECKKASEKNSKVPKLTINNKTGQQFTLTLRGPKTYYLTVPTGKSNFEVEQGKYTYSYTACGGPQTGNVNVKKGGANLKLECKKASEKNSTLIKVTINNKTGGYIYITLTGPHTYNFTVAPGKSKIEVEKGKYNFTVRGCGGASSSGTRNFKGSFVWTWFCTP
jgi:hypothetical protein